MVKKIKNFVPVHFLVIVCLVGNVHVAHAADVTESSMSATEMLRLINVERSSVAVGTVTLNEQLTSAAQRKADLMADSSQFAHTLADGTTAWDLLSEVGYSYRQAGENLAVYYSSESEVVDAWMHSELHRITMLNGDYKEAGIAFARGTYQGYDAVFVVLLIARPMEPLSSFSSFSSSNFRS